VWRGAQTAVSKTLRQLQSDFATAWRNRHREKRRTRFRRSAVRFHPAASGVKVLSQEIPASTVFSDLLCIEARNLRGEPFQARRRELESQLALRRRLTRHARQPRVERRVRLFRRLRAQFRGREWDKSQPSPSTPSPKWFRRKS
jgi:ATP-dependent DNA ligase